MKKIVSLVAALIVALQPQAQKVAISNTLLWKVSGNGITKDSYIFLTGSSCDESLKLTEKIKFCLKEVNTIAVEYDLYGSKDVNKLSANNIATSDSQKMKTNLSAAQITLFETALKNAGYPEQAIPKMQVYTMCMGYYTLLGINSPCGLEQQPLAYELELKALAKKGNKTYTVLQSIDEFIKESNTYTSVCWKNNIGYVLKNADDTKMYLATEAELYKNGKLEELQLLYKKAPVFKLLYEDATYKDHINFLADRIEKQVQQTSSFIAMQIANILYDDCSVFEILTRKGYIVTPIN